MVTTLCLLTCALATAQPADHSDWLLTPRLARGQELVYSGSFQDNVLGPSNQFVRSYHLETTIFLLEPTPRGMNAAVLTVLELQSLRPQRGAAASRPRSVRLEMVRIDPRGRVEGAGGKLLPVPIEGPPSIECGALVEVPLNRVALDNSWEVDDAGRPPRLWHVAAIDTINNTRCLKLVGEQRSPDWEHPRADCCAWRRVDTVWLSPSLGVACRVERIIERKEPARDNVSQRSVLRYDLLSHLTYPGRLFADRERVILQARRFGEQAAPLLSKPGLYETQIDVLLKRIDNYLDAQQPVEPYTKAVVAVRRRLEAARRGEAAPEPVPEETAPALRHRVTLGQRAPDFVASDYIKQGSVRLQHLLGQPILLVFYNPASPTMRDVLRFAAAQQKRGVTVLGMAVAGDAETIQQQHAELHLTFPILAGTALKGSYGVDATPRLVVVDSHGLVRGGYTGWGSETPREVAAEIGRCLQP